MTVEVPPAEPAAVPVLETTTKDPAHKVTEEPTTVTTAVTDEPTLTTQIEPPTTTTTIDTTPHETEEAHQLSEEKPKRKGLFNNPFANKVKKDSEEAVTALADTAETSENKISKGFGSFLSKVKQTASSNNIKELSEPTGLTTTSVLVEGENAQETENVHEIATTTTETPTATVEQTNYNKRQSLLSKLFGGGANKKKEEESTHEETDREVTTASSTAAVERTEQQTESDEPSSPPLSRRVTGFFAKKIPKLEKKAKSNDKTETPEEKPVEEQAPTPTVDQAPTPTADGEVPQPSVTEVPVVTVTETASPAPPAPVDTPSTHAPVTTTTATTA